MECATTTLALNHLHFHPWNCAVNYVPFSSVSIFASVFVDVFCDILYDVYFMKQLCTVPKQNFLSGTIK